MGRFRSKANCGRAGLYLAFVVLAGPIPMGLASATSAPAFAPPRSYDVGLDPIHVVAADLNADGKLDLVTANASSDYVSVLLASGGGRFARSESYDTNDQGGPFAIATTDFNGDGKRDLAVADAGTSEVSLLIGAGDGTFDDLAVAHFNVGARPTGIAAADFNGDGKQDLVTANLAETSVSVLLGNGDGTFRTAANYPAGTSPDSVVVADANRDGKTDLAVANFDSNDVSVLLGNGDGSFRAPASFAVGTKPHPIVVADLNADGKADLVTANHDSNNLTVLLGNGDGSFQGASYAAGQTPVSVAAADFDGDGRLDLVSLDADSSKISILLGNGDGTFQARASFPFDKDLYALTAADLTGDGKQDLAVTAGDSTVSVFRNVTGLPGCTVPDLRRQTLAKARIALTHANCTLGTQRRAYSKKVKRGRVISQKPAAGTQLSNSAAVSVVISRGRKH
jgi:hypothetical protein